MKFIHISDTHLVAHGEGHYASDPAYKLKKAIESINTYQNDADFVVITGDLTDKGELLVYYDLKSILDNLLIPYYLIIGNHDNRDNYFAAFNDKYNYESFAQLNVIKNDSLLLFLDTKIGDWHDGGFCESRFKWLENKLEENKHLPSYLFMHHPPFIINHKHMDNIGFGLKEDFWNIIEKYKNVKHIFFGHVHLLISGVYRGVGYSSTRSTNHQVSLISQGEISYFSSSEQPTYAIVNINQEQVNSISHEYLTEEFMYKSFIPTKETNGI